MKTVLITGGAGFIGTNTADYFFKQGWKVVIFDNLSRTGVENNLNPKHTLIRGDVRCQEDFKKIKYPIDAIINLAANPGIPWSIENPIYDAQINLMGCLNVLEFARRERIPVIQASTNKVYSDKINLLPIKELSTRYTFAQGSGIGETFPMDGQGQPHSPYGCSKASADLYCQEYNTTFDLPTVVCRMSCIYGPYQMGVEEQGWVLWFMLAKKKGLPINIYGNGKQVRDLLYAEDLAKLYWELVTNIKTHRGQVYNIGGGVDNTISLIELIDWLNNKGGKELEIIEKDWRIADHKVYVSDISKISPYWKPEIDVDEGLDRSWEWIKEKL